MDLAVAAHREGVSFAIDAKRIATVWQTLTGLSETDWTDAIDIPGAQVAVATYCPAWWPTSTRLLIRRVALAPEQISADPRSRRRRTLHPDQRALPLDELAGTDTVYGYSFILTNLDISTPDQATAVEHWYRHRTTIENIFRDAKHGAALRHGDHAGQGAGAPAGQPGPTRGAARRPVAGAHRRGGDAVVRDTGVRPYSGQIRATTCEVELGGVTIPAHAVVFASIPAANLDSQAFPDPDRLDVTRENAANHVTFGYGMHHCLGAQLARMALGAAVSSLLAAFPGLRLTAPAEEITYTEGFLIAGVRELPVTW